jgi:hypothetical protein
VSQHALLARLDVGDRSAGHRRVESISKVLLRELKGRASPTNRRAESSVKAFVSYTHRERSISRKPYLSSIAVVFVVLSFSITFC